MDQSALQMLLLLISILFMPILNCQQHAFFYIKSANSSYCPEQADVSPCYDLNTFISGKHWLSSSNTTLQLFPGEHFLELDLVVGNTEEFLMLPYIQPNDSTARISITCTNHGQTIQFTNVTVVKVDSISFHSCGVNDDSYGALQLRSVYHSEVTNSKWYESKSSAIFIQDSNTVMSDCQFVRGNCNYCSGGGIQAEKSNITFTGSNAFKENCAEDGGGLSLLRSNILLDGNLMVVGNSANSDGGGMYLEDCTLTATNTSHLTVEHNSAGYGGGMYFDSIDVFFSGTVVVASNSAEEDGGGTFYTVTQCYFSGYALYYNNSCGFLGGGSFMTAGYLSIEDANFTQNSALSDGGAFAAFFDCIIELDIANFVNNVAVKSGGGIEMVSSFLTITGYVSFSANMAIYGGGIHVTSTSYSSECTFENTAIFSGNKAEISGGAIALDHSVLKMEESSEITSNSAQYGGAIHAIASELHFIGNHSFINNYAQFGGAFSLSCASLMNFDSLSTETHVQMISNYAYKHGGAIWVEDTPFYTCNTNLPVRKCFYQSEDQISYHTGLYIFDNNTAILAGSNIYGGVIYNCLYNVYAGPYSTIISKQEFNSIFSSVNKSANSSPISSDPTRMCLCTQYNEPDCSLSDYTVEAFSGQQFSLTLVGVGQNNGTVPAVTLSCTDPPSTDTVKTTGRKCTTLFYTISSDSSSVALMLYPQSQCNNISTYKLKVFVNIKPCPPGFMLHNETKSCTCDDTMRKLDIQCDINSQSFAHKHGVWVDYKQFNENTSTVIYHPHCPFDYCTQEWTNFTFNSTDNQCRYNRSGLICGACKEGYSLTLGGPKCTQCSHVYLLLFFPLAVAGVVLVFFLLTFRITVSMGTINGLIFFANIIGTDSSIFLPPESTVILRVFIAWLNLDLGISTCLFDGLDMYTKVWLQFIFPFYVFILTGIIIVLSQRSTTFTKYLGSDPVAVLATLILLAYTKLFRTILTVMSFTYIQSSHGASITVWLYDGNIRYLSGKHIPLFLFALLILLLLIVPYTMILLFAPCLLHCSQNKFLFWIDDRRLKPFLFSYYAPLKNKYRSWISILLLFRLCLLILFVSNFIGNPSINLFAITAALIFMSCSRVLFGTFYTNWFLDFLELFFIMNLGLFSLSTLYVLNTGGNQRALADTLIGIVFIVFMAITMYHGWKQLTDSRWWRLAIKQKLQRYFDSKNEGSLRAHEDDRQHKDQPMHSQVQTTFIDLRESLLDTCD